MSVRTTATRGLLALAMGLAASVAVGCAPTVSFHTVANPAAAFDHYWTFSFGTEEGPPRGYETSARSAEVERRLKPFIEAALLRKGYSVAPAVGDLLVMFGSGRRAVPLHPSNGLPESWLPDDENGDFVEGSLVIDAFDANTNKRVWHGASHAKIDPKVIDNVLLEQSVADLMASFPTRPALSLRAEGPVHSRTQ